MYTCQCQWSGVNYIKIVLQLYCIVFSASNDFCSVCNLILVDMINPIFTL
jgi:hypothetical protein